MNHTKVVLLTEEPKNQFVLLHGRRATRIDEADGSRSSLAVDDLVEWVLHGTWSRTRSKEN